MIKAIYKRRSDGDYDFVAAFETEQLPAAPSNWPDEIVEWMNAENELPLIIENLPLNKLADVWCPHGDQCPNT
jgi:hypothetical protein